MTTVTTLQVGWSEEMKASAVNVGIVCTYYARALQDSILKCAVQRSLLLRKRAFSTSILLHDLCVGTFHGSSKDTSAHEVQAF